MKVSHVKKKKRLKASLWEFELLNPCHRVKLYEKIWTQKLNLTNKTDYFWIASNNLAQHVSTVMVKRRRKNTLLTALQRSYTLLNKLRQIIQNAFLRLKLWLHPALCSNCSHLSVAFSEKQIIFKIDLFWCGSRSALGIHVCCCCYPVDLVTSQWVSVPSSHPTSAL